MRNETICGFSSRNKLIDRLVDGYRNHTASKIILLTGPSGCGKSYVANKVVSKSCKPPLMLSYINYGDSFISPSSVGNLPKLKIDNFSFSAGFPYFSAGIDIGVHREESQYNRLKSLLRTLPNGCLLFCLDGLSAAHNQVRSMTKILLSHREDLERVLSSEIYFLLTDTNDDVCVSLETGAETVTHFAFHPYNADDILTYLRSKHLELMITDTVKQNIQQIQKISNGNLHLADFLFVDITSRNSNYFEALEHVIKIRLSKLKKDGLSKEISEADMEDIILSSSLSLQPFTTAEISSVTNRSDNTVAYSLDMAKEDAFLDKNYDCFYDFRCPEIKSALEQQSIEKRKERLLHYYQYYTENEQDEYYIRAFYLVKYYKSVTPQAFALLGLAFASGFSMLDYDLLDKIDDLLQRYGIAEQRESLHEIQTFYETINKPFDESDPHTVNAVYLKLRRADFEIPLKAELSRAYFYFLYRTQSPFDKDLNLVFQECLTYAKNELLLTVTANPIKFKPSDETIVRLNIIYCLAPYILDVLNSVDDFTELYNLSLMFSSTCSSKSAKGLGQYIENIFNRKAFLFVNQAQCGPYYERAKTYFSRNQIWDEMCMTLVCQAGTDIVIQKYDEAQDLCKQALEIVDQYGIVLPQPEKLQNNLLIAEFLQTEKQAKKEKVCMTKAKQTISKLKKLLCKKPCATEFVILTNICSLCLYCGNDQGYLKYKTMLEQQITCKDVSDVEDLEIDDFYRYYFAWFEIYRMTRDGNWDAAERLSQSVRGFVPALFQKQEKFWEMKDQAIADLIQNRTTLSAYDFCNNLVHVNRRENILSHFFFRGLMLSDLQYTSYN